MLTVWGSWSGIWGFRASLRVRKQAQQEDILIYFPASLRGAVRRSNLGQHQPRFASVNWVVLLG